MGKKSRSWFSLVKRLFVSEPKSKSEKKSKRWRWVFGGLKPKQYPKLAAPSRIISEAREEQRKHAMAVAIATAAAAEAAVVAARAAAEVVRLTGVPHESSLEYVKWTRNLAATKIQAAYRAHLARKALKALKGLVRLQARVRGRIVRRQVITNLKSLPPTEKTQSQLVHEVRVPTVDGSCRENEKQFLSLEEELEEKKLKLRCNSQKNWDYSLFSKEDMEALWSRKQEANAKRERMKKYSFSHREKRSDQNLETLKENGRWSNHLEQRVLESEGYKRREILNCKSIGCSNFLAGDMYGTTRLRLRNMPNQDSVELNSPFTHPRRSFCHVQQKSIGDETSLPNSPIFPTYMAATESAKAKARSMSTPKQRLGFLDTCSDYNSSPYKLGLSSWSSFNGAIPDRRQGATQQISLSMNGLY